MSARIIEQKGPATICVTSMTLMPSRGRDVTFGSVIMP
ncbi:hypothetical protein MGWOODY_Clf424 [hydrothermal vent metagenome]|uniref:Uncharacterized protein n=1 Tax=hydrothermal vent metagenome TaxID=652676 RepID=A0A160VAE8_9ZZZZ